MAMSDSWLLDASWAGLIALVVIVAAIGVAAFGRDLLPAKPRTKTQAANAPELRSKSRT